MHQDYPVVSQTDRCIQLGYLVVAGRPETATDQFIARQQGAAQIANRRSGGPGGRRCRGEPVDHVTYGRIGDAGPIPLDHVFGHRPTVSRKIPRRNPGNPSFRTHCAASSEPAEKTPRSRVFPDSRVPFAV